MDSSLVRVIEDLREYARNAHPGDKVLEAKIGTVLSHVQQKAVVLPEVHCRPRVVEIVADGI